MRRIPNLLLLGILILVMGTLSSCFAKSKELNIMDYGAKGNGKNDDSQAVIDALDFIVSKSRGERYTLFFPEGEYPINVQYSIDNITLKGEGILVPVQSKNDFILHLTGDSNRVEGLSFIEKSFSRELLVIIGDNNLVTDCCFDSPTKSRSQKVVYSDRLLSLAKNTGKGNVVQNCTFNNGRVGVELGGSYKLLNSTISNCIMGVLARSSTTDSEIAGNTIRDNNVNHNSGSDGILAQRNVRNLHIHHNKISNSGEHGIYFQGDNSIIEENEVYDNYRSGIKLASYNTGLYDRGEKDYYIGHSNVIRKNHSYNNSQDGKDRSNAGIYLQAPLRNITVENNVCYGNFNGIKSASVSKLKEDEYATRAVLTDLHIINNEVNNNRGRSLSIEGETGIEIINNKVDDIMTSSKAPAYRMESPLIKGNIIKEELLINRAQDSRIEGNEIERLNINSNSRKNNHRLKNNKIRVSNE